MAAGGTEEKTNMKASNGWVKLHRKLLENPIAQKPNYFSLWVHLLLKANHQENKHMWNGGIIIIKEGQMITGRKALSLETGIPQTTIEDILKYLETQQQIRQQKTTKFRLITIINWKDYQESDNKATTKRQQSDTNKNVNNVKNVKNTTTSDEVAGIPEVIKVFKDSLSPSLNYGNKTQRSSSGEMIRKYGLEGTLEMCKVVIAVQGKKYAPRASTPHAMWIKLGDFKSYFDAEKNKQPKVVKV